MSFQKLDDLGRKLESLEHALSILGADEATHMAVGGGEKRAEAMANLAGMYHAQATAPQIADWIEAARPETEDQTLALAEFKRQYINATCLPTDFVERRTAATMMVQLGVSPDVVEKCLNHMEPNKLKRIYQRASSEVPMREAWRLLGERLDLLVNKPANVVMLRAA